MSEIITVFEKHELPAEYSRIEVKNYYGDGNRFGFEITCVRTAGWKSTVPELPERIMIMEYPVAC